MEFTRQEIADAVEEIRRTYPHHYEMPLNHHVMCWLWLNHLYDAAINSDLVGWENIEIEKFLGRDNAN